jgi:hypothetical protein
VEWLEVKALSSNSSTKGEGGDLKELVMERMYLNIKVIAQKEGLSLDFLEV